MVIHELDGMLRSEYSITSGKCERYARIEELTNYERPLTLAIEYISTSTQKKSIQAPGLNSGNLRYVQCVQIRYQTTSQCCPSITRLEGYFNTHLIPTLTILNDLSDGN